MPVEQNFELRLPGDREVVYNYINTLCRNEQGKPILVECQEQVPGLETPVELKAYDVYGQPIFPEFSRLQEPVVIKGKDHSMWECQVTERRDGLPVTIERTYKNEIDLSRIFASEELKESLQEIQGIKKELVRIEYDQNGRPINIANYSVIDAKNSLDLAKPLLSLKHEVKYHYDEDGRLKAVARLVPRGDGDVRVIGHVEFYAYELIASEQVRITKYHYKPLHWRDLKDGACIEEISITDINPKSHDVLAHAIYLYEKRDTHQKIGDTKIADYQRVKRYPDLHTLRRLTQKPWQNYYSNSESLPANLTVPTYVTREDFENYIKGSPLAEIGRRVDQKEKVEVLFLDEYLEKINKATEEELIETINSIMHGRLTVHVAGQNALLGEVVKGTEVHQMDIVHRLAVIAIFLLEIILTSSYGLESSDYARERISALCQKLNITRKSRLDFLGNYMERKGDNIGNELKDTLRILQFLENIPDIVVQSPQRFRDLLDL